MEYEDYQWVYNKNPIDQSRDEDPNFFPLDPAQLKIKSDPDPTLIRNEKKKLCILMRKKIFVLYIVTAVHQ